MAAQATAVAEDLGMKLIGSPSATKRTRPDRNENQPTATDSRVTEGKIVNERCTRVSIVAPSSSSTSSRRLPTLVGLT
jgi:hypothetical protein